MTKYKKSIGMTAIAILLAFLVVAPSFAGEPVVDIDISYWVRDSLRIDPRVDVSKISVSSEGGIVTLSGRVNNLAAKQYADFEAKKINGVVGVINKIKVMPTWRSDIDIRHAVKRRILGSAAITSEGIMVASDNGQVILTGEVANWGEVQQAGLLTSEVLGVQKITNNLVTVWRSERSDQTIKNDAIAALQRDVYLSGLPISVGINGGIITLIGSVGSAFESDRAMQKVRWISNVKGVVSDLKIEGWENCGARKKTVWPSDDALKRAVKDELAADSRVTSADISIRSYLGAITLDGTVNSYYQMQIAEQDANDVVGVAYVTNNLLVTSETRSDWQIQDDIIFNFEVDYTLEDFDLKNKVKDGVVTLTGEVHYWFEKYHAADVAAGVLGVKWVINRIAVHQAGLKNAKILTKDITNGLKWNWTTWPVRNDIKVSVTNGIASLAGDVHTWSERREADRVALRTDGVWAVDNQLTVNGYNYQWNEWFDRNIPEQYDPYYYPDYIPYYDDYPFWWGSN